MTDRRTESCSVEIISFFRELFRPVKAMKQFCCAAKPFSAFGADGLKRPMVIKLATRAAESRWIDPETVKCEPSASSLPSPS
jgi:hypothetical protein